MMEENNVEAAPNTLENTNKADSKEADATKDVSPEEAPRKTPLELVRERQAQQKNHQSPSGRAANERQAASANSYKRRQHQRRAG